MYLKREESIKTGDVESWTDHGRSRPHQQAASCKLQAFNPVGVGAAAAASEKEGCRYHRRVPRLKPFEHLWSYISIPPSTLCIPGMHVRSGSRSDYIP